MFTCYVYFGLRMYDGIVSEHIALETRDGPNSRPLYISFCSADKKHGFLLSDPQKIAEEKQELSKDTFYIQLLDFSALERFFSVMQETESAEGFFWNEPLTPFKRGLNSATVAAYFLKLGGIIADVTWSNQDDCSFLYTSSRRGVSSLANKALYRSFCILSSSADDIACLFHFAQNTNLYLGPRAVRDLAVSTRPFVYRMRRYLSQSDDTGEEKIAEVVAIDKEIEEVEAHFKVTL